MMNIPNIGSTVAVKTVFRKNAISGVVIKPFKWLSANEFCLQTGLPEYPISVIHVNNILDLQVISGKVSKIRKFKIREYIVTENQGHFSCSCIGFKYHAKCKHVAAVQQFVAKKQQT
jgi:hypothetical protein